MKVHSQDFISGSKVYKIYIQTSEYLNSVFMTLPTSKAILGQDRRVFNLAVTDEFFICVKGLDCGVTIKLWQMYC